jgi:hypothetical protein
MKNIPIIKQIGPAGNDEFTLTINGNVHSYTDNKEGKRAAILDCLNAVPLTAVHDDIYLPANAALEVVATVLYPEGIASDKAYQTAVTVTNKACAHLGYGPEEELGPPAVPFSARGTYRKRVPPVTQEMVHDQLALAGTNSICPEREVTCFALWNKAGFDVYGRHWSKLTDGEQMLIQTQVDEIVAEAGWQKDDNTGKYSQALPIDAEAAHSRVISCLAQESGRPVSCGRVITQAQVGAYGKSFFTNDMSPELEAIVNAALRAGGYVATSNDGQYHPLPIPFTPETETAVLAGLANLPTVTTTFGQGLLLTDLLDFIKSHIRVETISEWQAESLVAKGAISEALRQLGYQAEATWCQAYDIQSPLAKEQVLAQEVILKEIRVKHEANKRISLAKGLSVLAPALTIDDKDNTLVYLEMLGHKEAVKANWAALMGGGKTHCLDGARIQLDGMKAHVKMQTSLPCGWADHVLLHKQASLKEMNPENPFYLLDDGSQPVPPLFYAMLNKALAIPVLPQWVDYLWQNGREAKLIELLDDGKGQGYAAWRVKALPDSWQEIVQGGLKQKQIVF